jgi:hypothetical protein
MKESLNKDSVDYNSEPVLYCEHCLSLKIRNIPSMEDSDYCDDCGATSVKQCSIEEWENLYVAKYGHKLLDTY